MNQHYSTENALYMSKLVGVPVKVTLLAPSSSSKSLSVYGVVEGIDNSMVVLSVGYISTQGDNAELSIPHNNEECFPMHNVFSISYLANQFAHMQRLTVVRKDEKDVKFSITHITK